MDWRDREAEADWNYDVLWCIVAMLFSLAYLADRASGVSVWRRRRVLGILMYGEAEARSLVIGMATGTAVEDDQPDAETGAGTDAAHLAARLRGLALMLCVLLARLPGRVGAVCPRAGRGNPATGAGFRHRCELTTPDTS